MYSVEEYEYFVNVRELHLTLVALQCIITDKEGKTKALPHRDSTKQRLEMIENRKEQPAPLPQIADCSFTKPAKGWQLHYTILSALLQQQRRKIL